MKTKPKTSRWFKTSAHTWHIDCVRVAHDSESFLVIKPHPKASGVSAAKHSADADYWPTLEKAKDHLRIRAQQQIKMLEEKLVRLRGVQADLTPLSDKDINPHARAIRELRKARRLDAETAHAEADQALCDLLATLGFGKVVREYKRLKLSYV